MQNARTKNPTLFWIFFILQFLGKFPDKKGGGMGLSVLYSMSIITLN